VIERVVAADQACPVSAASYRVTLSSWLGPETSAGPVNGAAAIEFAVRPPPANRIRLKRHGADRGYKAAPIRCMFPQWRLELEVPRGAPCDLQTRDGDIQVFDVSIVSAATLGGDLSLEGVKRSVEARTIRRDICLETRTVRLSSIRLRKH